jgi:hypothetical protein
MCYSYRDHQVEEARRKQWEKEERKRREQQKKERQAKNARELVRA